MRRSVMTRWSAAALAASVAVAGCSGGENDGDPDTKRESIASIMGARSMEVVDYDQLQKDMEEAIAACMTEEGWEYTPVTYPETGIGDITEVDELEMLQRQGFGVAYYILYPRGSEDETSEPSGEIIDPNVDYVASLTESEKEAYHDSLWGTQEEQDASLVTEIDPVTGEEYETVSGYGAGCDGKAYGEVYGNDPSMSPDFWNAMQSYYDELAARVEADPRMVKFTEEWSACMSDAGHDFADRDAFYDYIWTDLQSRVDAIVGADFYGNPMEGWTQDEIDEFWENATLEEQDALWTSAGGELTAEQTAQLEEILAEEIALGVSQFECMNSMTLDGNALYAEIEEAYALEHEEELTALAASLISGE